MCVGGVCACVRVCVCACVHVCVCARVCAHVLGLKKSKGRMEQRNLQPASQLARDTQSPQGPSARKQTVARRRPTDPGGNYPLLLAVILMILALNPSPPFL